MENYDKLENWIKNNYRSLNIEVRQLQWVHDFLPGFFDYECVIKKDHKKFVGRGIAQDENESFRKSLVEAIERWTCQQHGISTTGVALHPDPLKAKSKAQCEFYERFLFQMAYAGKLKATREKNADLSFVNLQKVKDSNIELHVFECLWRGLKLSVVEAEARPNERDARLFLGMGLKETRQESLRSAVSEALLNAVAYNHGTLGNMEMKYPSSWNEATSFAGRSVMLSVPDDEFDTPLIEITQLKLPIEIPLFAFRCHETARIFKIAGNNL